MPPRQTDPDLVRVVEGVSGEVPMRMELVIRFEFRRRDLFLGLTDLNKGQLQLEVQMTCDLCFCLVDLGGTRLRLCVRV